MSRETDKNIRELAALSLQLAEYAVPAAVSAREDARELRDRSLAITAGMQALSAVKPGDADGLRGAIQRLSVS